MKLNVCEKAEMSGGIAAFLAFYEEISDPAFGNQKISVFLFSFP